MWEFTQHQKRCCQRQSDVTPRLQRLGRGVVNENQNPIRQSIWSGNEDDADLDIFTERPLPFNLDNPPPTIDELARIELPQDSCAEVMMVLSAADEFMKLAENLPERGGDYIGGSINIGVSTAHVDN